MGKRSIFKQRKNDDYPTPLAATLPLLPHVSKGSTYIEPCAGIRGELTKHLMNHLDCVGEFDIITGTDARSHAYFYGNPSSIDYFITNPPWTRELLHPIIVNLSNQKPTWLLLDADWMHTKQAVPYLKLCIKIVSVGRVKWIPDSKFVGKDNACWYLFDGQLPRSHIEFVGR